MAVHADTAKLDPVSIDDGDEIGTEDHHGGREDPPPEPSPDPRRDNAKVALLVIAVTAAAVSALGGWFGYHAYQTRQTQNHARDYLDAARQGALDLTTISYSEVDADVQRVLAASTGSFRDDFQKRSQPFVDVVKQAQSKTTGSIAEAGIQSQDDEQAQVLVAVTVDTANTAAVQQQPRSWRMRITVQKTNDGPKMANVEFVP